MGRTFDDGYRRPFATLVDAAPGADVYPPDAFRTEWGPIFHRGRLDGTARVLVLGQDPATHETICRRILVGEAGQRVQGFLAKLGITTSYVLVNTFLYSVFGQGRGARHVDDAAIVAYRHRWLDAVARRSPLEAIVTIGGLADRAHEVWRATPAGAACPAVHVAMIHPTYPESASASGTITKADAMARLCESWNAGARRAGARRHARRRGRAVALRHDDHRRRPGADPVDRPAGRRPGVDARASTPGRRGPATTTRRSGRRSR